MAYMLPGPDRVQMEFVVPHVKRGDYYLFNNPVLGRSMYVYPRMMGCKTFAVDMPMGTDGDTNTSGFSAWLSNAIGNPQSVYNDVQNARAELEQARQMMTLAIAASLLASGLVVWMALFRR